MIVVIDTNVLLQARAPKHSYHRILRAWRLGQLVWAVSNEIQFEYEEILTNKTSRTHFEEFIALWEVVSLKKSQNCRLISPTYRFHQITACPDDDKFADCAISAGADFIISDDAHFNALIGSGYKPQPITPEEFIARFLTPA